MGTWLEPRQKKVVLVVGAEWICNIADQHPGAIQIVDIWHAREHLWEMAAKLFPADHPQRKSGTQKLIRKLDRGWEETVVAELAPSRLVSRICERCSVLKQTTSSGTGTGCAIPSPTNTVYS